MSDHFAAYEQTGWAARPQPHAIGGSQLRRSLLLDQPSLRSGRSTWCADNALGLRVGGKGLHNKRPEPHILHRHQSDVADKPVQAHSQSLLGRPSSLEQADQQPRMQRSGWKETIKPSSMAEDYEVQTEMLSGTARLTPRMPRSSNVTIWFCSWSITRHKVTLRNSDGQGFIRSSWQRCRQKGLRMPTHAQNKECPNTIICIDAHHWYDHLQ